MKPDMLIFKGKPEPLVTLQKYEGVPDFPDTITLDNETYELTVFSYGPAQYLIAHNTPLNESEVIAAINHWQPTMLS